MFLLIVYDTEQKNCARLHKLLKRYLNWNQNSVFEGSVTRAQYTEIRMLLEKERAKNSHITLYCIESECIVEREELGDAKGNVSNII